MRKSIIALALGGISLIATPSLAAEHKLTIVNIEFEGSKVWTPLPIVVKKGDKIVLKLINNVKSDPNQHGFSIPEFKVNEVVNRGEPKTVEFVADKAGIFPVSCQLHPAHVGGQIVVLE